SASPELFFKVENNTVTARPMKGTIHRGYTYETDLQHKEWLSASEKNKLENTIIKDLMEKELEKVTIPGTLRTIDPFRVDKYPTRLNSSHDSNSYAVICLNNNKITNNIAY